MRSPQNWMIILHSEPDFVLVQGTQGSIKKKTNSPLKTSEFDLNTFELRTDAKAGTPILWPPHVKS